MTTKSALWKTTLCRGITASPRILKLRRRLCWTALAIVVFVAGFGAVFGYVRSSTQTSMPTVSQLGAPPQVSGYHLVFEDDFTAFDLSPDGKGAHTWHEGVWWSEKHAPLTNISASGGMLTLKWQRSQNTPDTSITTFSRDKQHFTAFRYGYFEARMRWDVVRGAWPAFWLIPVQSATSQNVYNGTKEAGEIDIFEGQGDHPRTFYGTIHDWVGSDHKRSGTNTFHLPKNTDLAQFHVYGLLWTPGRVTWYFDNQPLHSEPTPPVYDKQDFFIVLGMQEGVDWTYSNMSGVTAPEMNLHVNWIRVWQKQDLGKHFYATGTRP